MIKQVIVVRKNLNMRKGKIAAQVAHASMAVLLNHRGSGFPNPHSSYYILETWPECKTWLEGSFTKIVCYVDTDEQWNELKTKLILYTDLPYAIITDSGRTEFNGVPTETCLAIGPHTPEVIDPITGEYKLL